MRMAGPGTCTWEWWWWGVTVKGEGRFGGIDAVVEDGWSGDLHRGHEGRVREQGLGGLGKAG